MTWIYYSIKENLIRVSTLRQESSKEDLLVPNQLERDEAGHIVGARSLARN